MNLPKFNFDKDKLIEYSEKKFNLNKIVQCRKFKSEEYQKYIRYLNIHLSKLLVGTLDELEIAKNSFDKIINFNNKLKCSGKINRKNCNKCQECKKNKLNSEFNKRVINSLNYQPSTLYNYFHGLTNSACYICNAQYTLVANSKSKIKLIFEFDHYYPKSLYPALSISLHNLFPICGSCNKFKGNREYDISKMYKNLKFRIDSESLTSHITQNSKLVIQINDSTKISEKFYLHGIYDNHIDYIEELIQRKLKYNKCYKSSLEKKFGKIVGNVENIDTRLELGTYTSEEGIYKRPLSKFLQDINEQLDML
ncbi:hypothetical protein [Chryseobacterium taiwanense]|uniref:HNH domain-containing protein n=1 Tax=Chryseobacterium taiwanense TaxID=363331 RepID=A0A0B4CJB8_9FLAO|nr:hypothetical protein [Chryseobacterium taiwanense]KIC61334.1 hypothetical protein RM51_17810 [Chryseobacterium taiwanense]